MKAHYGLEVSLQASEEPNIQSSVYSSLLLRSIRELLFNVVKHSGVQKAFIQLKVKDRYLIITIKDTGMGCNPEVLQAKRQNNATFGLFDIEDRINFLGGYMDVESEAGHGFCVTLWVPRDVNYSSEIDRPAILVDTLPDIRTEHDNDKPSSVPSRKRPIKILLTDDHAIMRDGLAELIDGHADIKVVGMAANGREAVELAEKLRPEAILMDVSMPVMNGIEATRQIKEVFPEMIIIGLTMHKDPDIHQAMKKVGASACISKSGSLKNLVESIRSLYSGRQ
jgi:CheY-like chemotaxis protein